jgi:hypothetical protein
VDFREEGPQPPCRVVSSLNFGRCFGACRSALIEGRPSRTAVSSWNVAKIAASLYQGSGSSTQPVDYNVFSSYPDFEPMDPNAQRQKRRDAIVSSLNVAIEASNLAREVCSITPAKAAFGSFGVILTMIRVRISTLSMLIDCWLIRHTQESMTNETDCVELGLACAEVCTALSRGLDGKLLKDLNNSACEAIKQLTT